MKIRAGEAAEMIMRTFPGTVILEWGGRKYVAPPPIKEKTDGKQPEPGRPESGGGRDEPQRLW